MPGFVENVNTVALGLTPGFIQNVTAVASIQGAVSVVAADALSVVSVATNVVPNLAEILLADTNAGIATTQAGIAAAAAVAAGVSEQNTTSLYDQFDDRYLGNKTLAPTLDNDGNALLIGALYFDTVSNMVRVWDGVLWGDALTLTAASISTLTNKTLDHISNTVGADHIHYKVRNESGSIIPVNTVVTASGTQPGTDYILVVPITDPQTQIALGIVHTALAVNGTGLVINTGVADDVNTSTWTVGTILYPSTTGGLTTVKPTSGRYQTCAIVLRQHNTQGTLLCEFTEPKVIASTSQSGYVQLNDTLTSASITQALTASQGKVLQDTTEKVINRGAVNGYAPLDANAQVPATNLPSYVDDVLEVATKALLPITGEVGKIYVVVADESAGGDTSSYRWTGAVYAMVSNTLTGVDIKNLYVGQPNTFQDTDKTKLNNITITQSVNLDILETNSDASKVVTDKMGVTAVTSVTFNADGSITIVTP